MAEEEKEIKENEDSSEQKKTKVGFPRAPEPKSGFNFTIFFVLLIILLAIGGAAWYLFGRSGQAIVTTRENSPTPEEAMAQDTVTPTEASVDRTQIKIQILNGTGISGAAGKLEDTLKSLGYSDFKTANADSFTHKSTEVNFASSLSDSTKEEIKKELNSVYEDVIEGTTAPQGFDVSITVGFRKGDTPSPSPKASTATPSPSETTGTVTPTP